MSQKWIKMWQCSLLRHVCTLLFNTLTNMKGEVYSSSSPNYTAMPHRLTSEWSWRWLCPHPQQFGRHIFLGQIFQKKLGQFLTKWRFPSGKSSSASPSPLKNVLYDYVWPWFKTNLCSRLTVTFKLQLVICYSKQLLALQYYTTINITLVFLIS